MPPPIKLLFIWFPGVTLLMLLFLFLSQSCISTEDGIIINSFGGQIHREHVKHEGWRTASSPCWVRVKGFVVRNTDVGYPLWQQCVTRALPPHPRLNVWSGKKMLFTPALSIRPFVSSKGNPFPYHLVVHSPLSFMWNHVINMIQAGMSVWFRFFT